MSTFHLVAILLVGFINYVGIGLVYPVFAALLFDQNNPLIAHEATAAFRGASLGLLIALTPLTQIVSSPLLGALSDVYGRKKTLLIGTGFGCLGYGIAVLGIWCHSLLLLLLYRFLIGVAEGTVGVAQALIADISDGANKTRRFGLFNASLGTGFTVGPFLGGWLCDFGYLFPFVAAGSVCLINLLMIACKFPELPKMTSSAPQKPQFRILSIGKAFTEQSLKWLFLATFVFAFGWSIFSEFIPLLLKARFGFTPRDTGNYYAFASAWYALSAAVLCRPLLKKIPAEKIIGKALVGCAACMLLFLLIPDSCYIWYILPLMMYGMSLIFPNLSGIVSSSAGLSRQGEMMGLHQSVIGCAMGLSPLMVGPLVGAFPPFTAWAAALCLLLASQLFWATRKWRVMA